MQQADIQQIRLVYVGTESARFKKEKCKYEWRGEWEYSLITSIKKDEREIAGLVVIVKNGKCEPIRINTTGSFALETLCKLYQAGVIEFVNYDNGLIEKKKAKIKQLQEEIEILERGRKSQ